MDLILTFMQTPGSRSDPRALIGWYFNSHANQIWLVQIIATSEGKVSISVAALLEVHFAFLYQGRELFAKYCIIACAGYTRSRNNIWHSPVFGHGSRRHFFELCTGRVVSRGWKSNREIVLEKFIFTDPVNSSRSNYKSPFRSKQPVGSPKVSFLCKLASKINSKGMEWLGYRIEQ